MLKLKNYQKRALGSLERFLEEARLQGPSSAFVTAVDKGLREDYSPLPGQPDVPYVCLRIPTGGGKTVMGAHIIKTTGATYLDKEFPLVLWLVPTTQIKTQTLDALKDPRHPYRAELDDAFDGKVEVFDITDYPNIRPADIGTKVCVIVSTTAALRVSDTEGRKVYEHHEDLESHFTGAMAELPYLEKGENGKALFSFANLLAVHGPLVIMDEAHNATTPLSYEVYERLAPKVVVELTATPDARSSNILVSVSAFELKDENMIKFPLILKEHNGEWQAAVSAAIARRKELAKTALGEPDYIRPIILIQAENIRGEATVGEVKRHLLEVEKLPEKGVAIATGDQREIEGVDLFARDCPIEVIITVQALKEGWDCSFAYIFCSCAQVKSDKDIQQLLGRVLRMPYATPRKQEAMGKAYAHVVTDSFGKAAGELTQSLVNIGFNPLEAAAAIRKEEKTKPLPLPGGMMHPPTLPSTTLEVAKEPDLSNVPERDKKRVVFKPSPTGKGGTLSLIDEIDQATVDAIKAAVPVGKREEIASKIEVHQLTTIAAKAPSERGAVFQVPRLYVLEDGEQLELLERGHVGTTFQWDLLASPADLSSFSISEDAMTFEVFLEGKQVQFHAVKDDVATYLPGFAQDRTEADLIGWLDHEIREPSVKQPVLREWIRSCVSGLLEDRGFSLAQLLKSQFILRKKLREQLDLAKTAAFRAGFQQLLEVGEISAPDGPDHLFTYPADMTEYPAHSYYEGGNYKFKKHYYPKPGDLKWKTPAGNETEEYLCAQAIDLLENVEFWVRNLVHPKQFWMPTSRMRTYPDFVARLKDGRLFVIEYKVADRFSADQEKEKRMVGDLWEKRTNGRGLYLMAQKMDNGKNVREQLMAKIATV